MHSERRITVPELTLLGSLYITQYLGFSFFIEALVAILRKNGTALQDISVIYLLGFFWMFKFLWAPVVDRFTPVKKWKYKGWLLIFQFLLVAALLVTSRLDVAGDFKMIAIVGMCIGFLSSTQDVVVDALAYGLLNEKDRGLGNAVKTAGGMIGFMIGGGAGLMLYAWLGWEKCLYVLAALTAVSLFQTVFFREPAFRSQIRSSSGYGAYFFRYWASGRIKWLLLLIYYPIGICLAYILIAPILVDRGWGLEFIGLVVNVIGSAVGAVSALTAGMLVKKFGRKRMLMWLSVLQGMTILLLLLPVYGHSSTFVVLVSVCMILIVYSPSATVLSTIMMDQVSSEKPATDFAMQHSLYLMIGFLCGFGGTALAGYFGYAAMVFAASAFAFGAAIASALLYRPAEKSISVMELSAAES